jgi:catechol 2,3-dioxygenase-like lactoylglutathione lyase family enzyme
MNKPAIVAPVMRVLGVSDTARSVAFYRDVLDSRSVKRKTSGPTSTL